MKTWHMNRQHSYAYFPDSILIKLKVTHKILFCGFSVHIFLFLAWFKFPNVFIFLPFRLQWQGEDSIRFWLVPISSGVDFLVAFIWSDIILLAFTFARVLRTFYSLSPNPHNSDVKLLPLGQVPTLRGVWVLGRKAVGWEVWTLHAQCLESGFM